MRRARRHVGVGTLLFLMLGVLLTSPMSSTVRAEDDVAAPVYFDATGQVLSDPFLTGWEDLGGTQLSGRPVSGTVQSTESWQQWFEYTRLQAPGASLDSTTPEAITTTALGSDLARQLGLTRWHPAFQPVAPEVPEGTRYFETTQHTLANAFLQNWEKDDMGERLGAPISQEFSVGETSYQFFERGALSWHPEHAVGLLPLGYLDAAVHGTLQLDTPKPDGVQVWNESPSGGGDAVTGYGRWIDVNLSTYTMTAYEGSTPVLSTAIVDGGAGYETVTGTFNIYWKLPSQTMRGTNLDGSEYVTEDVPYVMYFYADYALHGAYWRSSFGYSGSHGCVNMDVGSAAWLFGWASEGTLVEVHY